MSFRWDFLCWGEKSAHLSADVAFFVSPQCGWFNDNVNHARLPRPSWTNTVFNLQKHCTLQTLLRRGDENVFTLLVIGRLGALFRCKRAQNLYFYNRNRNWPHWFLEKNHSFFFFLPFWVYLQRGQGQGNPINSEDHVINRLTHFHSGWNSCVATTSSEGKAICGDHVIIQGGSCNRFKMPNQ